MEMAWWLMPVITVFGRLGRAECQEGNLGHGVRSCSAYLSLLLCLQRLRWRPGHHRAHMRPTALSCSHGRSFRHTHVENVMFVVQGHEEKMVLANISTN